MLAELLLGVFSSDAEVVAYGVERMMWISLPYFLFGVMDVLVGMLRGLGYAMVPMAVSVIGVCGLRVVWIFTVFRQFQTLPVLYSSYMITWIITGTVHTICYIVIWKKMKRRFYR